MVKERKNKVSNEEPEPLYEFSQDIEEEIPRPSEAETADFKQQVSEWLKLDDQVRKLNIAIRERRTHQRALSSKVQDFMIKYRYDNLNTTQGVIKSNVRSVKQPLKMTEVRIKLDEIFNEFVNGNVAYTENEESVVEYSKFKKLIEDIFETERPTVVKQSLKRTIPKVSMRLEL
jgi:predicted  nucleic acid-binding Zn-ribbon protein